METRVPAFNYMPNWDGRRAGSDGAGDAVGFSFAGAACLGVPGGGFVPAGGVGVGAVEGLSSAAAAALAPGAAAGSAYCERAAGRDPAGLAAVRAPGAALANRTSSIVEHSCAMCSGMRGVGLWISSDSR